MMKYREPLRGCHTELVNALECHMSWPHNFIHALWRMTEADTPPPTDDETTEKIVTVVRMRLAMRKSGMEFRYNLIEDVYRNMLTYPEMARKHQRDVSTIRHTLADALVYLVYYPGLRKLYKAELTPDNLIDRFSGKKWEE